MLLAARHPKPTLHARARLGATRQQLTSPCSPCRPLAVHLRRGSGASGGSGGGSSPRHRRTTIAAALPGQAVQKAIDALKEDHGKPSDQELAAGAAAAAAAVATAAHNTAITSKTAAGYLLREAPLRTWLPLLACAATAAAAFWTSRERLIWTALGQAVSFMLTVWQVRHAGLSGRQHIGLQPARTIDSVCSKLPDQAGCPPPAIPPVYRPSRPTCQVLAPLVRRFQALRARLIDNDRAAKHRLDAAAEQLWCARPGYRCCWGWRRCHRARAVPRSKFCRLLCHHLL